MALDLPNRRKQKRRKFTTAVTIYPQGVGRVIDVSSGGIAFRCFHEQCLSEGWRVDIIDAGGCHLAELPVKKIWESTEDQKSGDSICITTVGVKFTGLSSEQKLPFTIFYTDSLLAGRDRKLIHGRV